MASSNYIVIESKEVFDNYSNPHNLKLSDFRLIVKAFFLIMVKELIYSYKAFVLPKGLGILSIRKRATIGRGVFDYKTYRTSGIKRYIKNNHSEQFAVNIFWDKSYLRVKDKMIGLFKFYPARDFSRELAKHIKQDNAISKYYDK